MSDLDESDSSDLAASNKAVLGHLAGSVRNEMPTADDIYDMLDRMGII